VKHYLLEYVLQRTEGLVDFETRELLDYDMFLEWTDSDMNFQEYLGFGESMAVYSCSVAWVVSDRNVVG